MITRITRRDVESVVAWHDHDPMVVPSADVLHAIRELATAWLRKAGRHESPWRAGQRVMLTERNDAVRFIIIKAVSQSGVARFRDVSYGGGDRRFRRDGSEMAGGGFIESV